MKIMRNLKSLFSILFIFLLLCNPLYAITIKDSNGKKVEIDDFYDTKGHWAHDAIKEWAEYEVIAGDGKGNFLPDAKIKRKDLACIFDRLFSLQVGALNTFVDLPYNKYYTDPMLRVNAAGLLVGTGDRLNPEGYTTRQELAAVLVRAFKLDTKSSSLKFVDDSSISSWAKGPVYALKEYGYWSRVADSKIDAKRAITRAEFMVILDNIIEGYYSSTLKTNSGATQFSNKFYTSNALVNRKGIEIFRSTIKSNVYLTQDGGKSCTFNQAKVDGTVFVLGDNATVSIKESEIKGIEIFGKASITGVDGVSTIKVHKWGTSSTLDGIPEALILDPNTKVSIKGKVYENSDSIVRTYLGSDIRATIANDVNTVEGGPSVNLSNILIMYNNNVMLVDGSVKDNGKKGIKEVGVVWLEDVEDLNIKPSLYNYDDIERYRGDFNKKMTFKVCKQDLNSTSAYRFYAIANDDLIGYSDVTYLDSFDFNVDLDIGISEEDNADLDAELEVYGDNIPDISSVYVLYGDSKYEDETEEVSLSLKRGSGIEETDRVQSKTYRGKLTFSSNKDEGKSIPEYYGYKIVFSGDIGEDLYFPVFRDNFEKDMDPYESISAGTATFDGLNAVSIKGNKVKSSDMNLLEVGLISKESAKGTSAGSPSVNDNTWKVTQSSTSVDKKSDYSFDTSLTISNISSQLNYAVYIKTSTGDYYYSSVRTAVNELSGDIGGPSVGNIDIKVLGDETALVYIPYISANGKPDIYVQDVVIAFQDSYGNKINTFSNKSLKDLNAYVDSDKVVIPFTGLTKGNVYSVALRLKNIQGYSNAAIFSIDMSNKININLSKKGTVGMVSSYYVLCPDDKVELKGVYNTTDNEKLGIFTDNHGQSFSIPNIDGAKNLLLSFTYKVSSNLDSWYTIDFTYKITVQ